MTSSLHIFGKKPGAAPSGNPYLKLGFGLNPFRSTDEDVRSGQVPFFEEYVDSQLRQISQWVDDVHLQGQREPFSLVGNIGVGKTALIGRLLNGLQSQRDERIVVDRLILSDAGYARLSVGGWLVTALERLDLPWLAPNPNPSLEVIPLLTHLSQAPGLPSSGRMGRVLSHIASQPIDKRTALLANISTWIKRGRLSDAQARALGVRPRLDWEGELIPIIGELLTLAAAAGLLRTFFLFVDQLEDLFTKALTPVRRSRVLTDLRGLIDVIEAGAPIGLFLSWAPSLDSEIRTQYPAVYSRLSRRRVELPLLQLQHAGAFATTWMEGQKNKPGYDVSKQPRAQEIATAAWGKLRQDNKLSPPGERATPRDFLMALAQEFDRRARIP